MILLFVPLFIYYFVNIFNKTFTETLAIRCCFNESCVCLHNSLFTYPRRALQKDRFYIFQKADYLHKVRKYVHDTNYGYYLEVYSSKKNFSLSIILSTLLHVTKTNTTCVFHKKKLSWSHRDFLFKHKLTVFLKTYHKKN